MPQTFFEWIGFLLPSRWDAFSVGFFSAIVGFLQIALGGIDAPIQALCVIALVDYLTGTLAALKLRQWSSSVGFRGLTKKASIFLIIGFCHWVDVGLSIDMLRTGAICAYTINEAGSVLENIDRLGYGHLIPSWIRSRLAAIKEERTK